MADEINGSVIIKEALDAVAVSNTHHASGLVLLFQALVADICGILGRPDDIDVRLWIARGSQVAGVGLPVRVFCDAHPCQSREHGCNCYTINRSHSSLPIIIMNWLQHYKQIARK